MDAQRRYLVPCVALLGLAPGSGLVTRVGCDGVPIIFRALKAVVVILQVPESRHPLYAFVDNAD